MAKIPMFERKRKIISGISIDTIGSIISMVVGFLVVPYYFKHITKEQYGVWLAVNSVIALITIVDVGTDQYLTTVIADDSKFYSKAIGNIILSTLLVKGVIVSIFGAVGLILYFFITSIISIDPSMLSDAKIVFILALIILLFGVFFSTISTIMYARHHYSLVNGFSVFSSIGISAGTIGFLMLDYEVIAFPLTIISVTVVQYTFLFILLKNGYPHIKFALKSFIFINKADMIKYSTSFQILKWVHTLRTQYIVLAINNLVGPASVTIYNLTNRLPQTVPSFASKIAIPMFPSFAEYFATGDIARARDVFLKVNRVLLRLSIFTAILVFFVSKPFVALWIGPDMFAGQGVLFCLTVYAFVYSSMSAFGIVIFSSKNFEKWTHWSIVEIVCAVMFSYVLSFKFGLLGIVIGFVVASMLNQIYLFRIVLRQLSISFENYLDFVIIGSLASNIVTLIAAFMIFYFFNMDNWIKLIMSCSAITVVHVLSNEGIQFIRSKEKGIKAKIMGIVKV